MVAATAALASVPGATAELTEYEQYSLELTNRARADPAAEVDRSATVAATQPGYWGSFTGFNSYRLFRGPAGLNEGPPVLGAAAYTIPPEPKQPLAPHPQLQEVARSYSALMQASDSIRHNLGGTSASQRLAAAGYTPEIPWASGLNNVFPGPENTGETATTDSFDWRGYAGDIRAEAVDLLHHNLFSDAVSGARNHRMTTMAADWREAGIGLAFGTDPGGFNSVYSDEIFGHRADGLPYITGVAYRDLDGDKFYTPAIGEPLGGLAVTVFKAGTAEVVATGETSATGGYAINVQPAADYDIRFFGDGIAQTFSVIAVGDDNVKVDAVDPGDDGGPQVPVPLEIIGVSREGGATVVSWTAAPGARYVVLSSFDVETWVPVGEVIVASTDLASATVPDPAAVSAGTRFFRVRRE